MPKYKGVQKKYNKWYWYINRNGRRYWSHGFLTAEEAAQDRTRQDQRLSIGINIDAGRITVRESAIIYLKNHVSKFSKATLDIRESNLRIHILPRIGHLRLRDLRPYHIEKLQNNLLKTSSVNNTRKIMTTLRNFLNRTVIWEFIDINPALKIEMPKKERRERLILNPEQFIKLLDNCESIKTRFIITLASFAGLCRGEIFGLQWQDFDFKEKTLTLQRQWTHKTLKTKLKTEKRKSTLPLLDEVIGLAKQWGRECGSLKWVFPSINGNGPMDVDNWYQRHYKRLLKTNNLPDVDLHSLRHSFASTAIASGISVADLQELMRHSNYQITMNTYVHVLPKQLDKALSRFQSYIGSIRRRSVEEL